MSLEEFASRGLKAQAAVDGLLQIEGSNDPVWLRRIAGDPDKALGERRAAERRLRILRKGQKDKTHKPPTPAGQQRMVDDWNRAHKQLGSRVRVVRDDGSIVETIATTQAYVLEGHTAVIFLQGFSGAYSLARCTAI
jgi:hypothetical protein